MDCDQIREAISARLDGEPAGIAASVADAHLAGCAGCRSWAEAAEALHRRTRIAAAVEVPDLTASVLAAARPAPVDERVGLARWGLVLVAVVQLAAAAPMLIAGSGPEGELHVAREIGSWDVALAIGFLGAAWRPHQAAGMVPFVAALVASLVITAAVDVASGRTDTAGEAIHSLEIAGLVLLWMLSRTTTSKERFRLRPA